MGEQYVVVGRISTVYGVKGWVKIHSHTEPRENIFQYKPWFVMKNNQRQDIEVVRYQFNGKSLVAHLKGCDDRDLAQEYVGSTIVVEKVQLPSLDEGEYYWSDLLGIRVKTISGELLGTVKKLMETGSNDVLVVKATPESIDNRERLIPYIPDQVICSINIEEKQMVVDWDTDF